MGCLYASRMPAGKAGEILHWTMGFVGTTSWPRAHNTPTWPWPFRHAGGNGIVIAVDGPAASGKGTLAKRLAEFYHLAHMDTGLLYRGATLLPPAHVCVCTCVHVCVKNRLPATARLKLDPGSTNYQCS